MALLGWTFVILPGRLQYSRHQIPFLSCVEVDHVKSHCRLYLRILGIFLGIPCSALCATVVPAFFGLGDLPGGEFRSSASGVSADGSVVVGEGSQSDGNVVAFRRTTATGMVGLGDLPGGNAFSQAYGVSGDGSTVIGHSNGGTPNQAFRWTAVNGMTALSTQSSIARAASYDGSVIAGYVQGVGAVRWVNGVMSHLGGSSQRQAYGVSHDGAVIAVTTVGTQFPMRWTAATGSNSLPGLIPNLPFGNALAVSGDGSTIVGNNYDGTTYQAVRWRDNGVFGLGFLPGLTPQNSSNYASAVSGDGTTIVGTNILNGSTQSAFVWDESFGMQRVSTVLAGLGVQSMNGWQLWSAMGISADGKTIVGVGRNPSGREEAWVAVLPEPTSSLLFLLGVGTIIGQRRRR